MAFLMTRAFVVPVWFLASVLVALLTMPSGMMATGLVLICVLAATAILVLATVAPEPEPSPFRANSWPDSGFRLPRRGARGR